MKRAQNNFGRMVASVKTHEKTRIVLLPFRVRTTSTTRRVLYKRSRANVRFCFRHNPQPAVPIRRRTRRFYKTRRRRRNKNIRIHVTVAPPLEKRGVLSAEGDILLSPSLLFGIRKPREPLSTTAAFRRDDFRRVV